MNLNRYPRRLRGIALVMVLWTTMLMSVLVGAQILAARTSFQFTRAQFAGAQASALAEAGVHAALYQLLTADGAAAGPLRLEWPFGSVEVRFENERGKLDINRASPDLLRQLFGHYLDEVQATALVTALEDFRDADDKPRDGGAELAEYRAAGLQDGPKNANLQAVSELLQVIGMTPALYRSVAPYLTVYSRLRGVTAQEADPGLLALLQLNDDGTEAAEEGLFESPLRPAEEGRDRPLRTTAGGYYTLYATAQTTEARSSIKAVVQVVPRAAPGYRVLSWQHSFPDSDQPALPPRIPSS